MVDIMPLNGLYYNKNKVNKMSKVISPPYDVISPGLKDKLLDSSPYNIVRLLLPEGSIEEKYLNACSILKKWIQEEIFLFDTDKCFYPFQISFESDNKKKKISGFMGLTRIEQYNTGKIYRHEKTLSKPKKDRMALLRECRTNFGPIYTLYRDREGKILNIFEDTVNREPLIDTAAAYDPSLDFKLWRVSDGRVLEDIINIMKDKALIIADGHHRYETSLVYKEKSKISSMGREEGSSGPQDHILTLFVESSQEDIEIYPTHRMIKFKDYPGLQKILRAVKNSFRIDKIDEFPDSRDLKEKLMKSMSGGDISFFIYGGQSYYLTLKKAPDPGSRYTDVNILHELLLKQVSQHHKIEEISYSHSTGSVKSSIDQKDFDIGIFFNPPSISDLESICYAGELMPQKSTYFFPKLCSGLIMYKFDRPL